MEIAGRRGEEAISFKVLSRNEVNEKCIQGRGKGVL